MGNYMALLVDTIACRFIKNSLLGFLVLMAWACQKPAPDEQETLPFYNTAEFDAEWISKEDARYPTIHTIAPFVLTNQLGHTITNDSLEGHIYVANFFYSVCPGICPKMMGNFKTLQDTFAANPRIKLVSFTVMPWVDSVGRLQKYGQSRGIDPTRWYLLTGRKEHIYTLGRTSYFAEKGLGLQKDSTSFLHTESMLLIDKKGRIRGIYNATQKPDYERVIDDVHVLLKEEDADKHGAV
ncbi:SCO family protein [Spirosoma gilvum]